MNIWVSTYIEDEHVYRGSSNSTSFGRSPCPPPSQFLPSFLSHPPQLTPSISSPAQTAMEVEGAGEDEEQRGKRLSDFYDIHQEIGRCGARRGCGVWGPSAAGSEGGRVWRARAAAMPESQRLPVSCTQGCLLLPEACGGA